MPDCGIIDFGCKVASAVQSGFQKIAQSAGEAAGQMISESLTWWVQTASVNPDTDVVRNLQAYTLPVAVTVLMGSVLVQAIRMILSRKKDPAVNVALGLIRYAVVTTIGLALLAAALKAGDALSQWLVDQAIADFSKRMSLLFAPEALSNPFGLLVLAALGYVLGAIQWLLGFIRQAGILVLAVMLPLAASGSINDSTKVWLNRLLPWLISLVLYKPMAALIYTIGFTMMGQGASSAGGQDPQQKFATVMTGLMVMVLAVIAMPSMLRFFSWAQVSASGGSGVGGVLAAGAMGAASMGGMSGRSPAVQQAQTMSATGPGSAPALPSGASGSGSTGSGGASGPGGPPGPGGDPSGGSAGGGAGAPAGAGAASGAGGGGAAGAAGAGGGAAAGAGGGAAGGAAAGGAAAAAGPAGAAVGAAAQVARGAYQAGQAAADGMTGGEQQS